MLGVLISRFGPPNAGGLEVAEVERPVPGAGEVLVEVRAAGLNPSDLGNVLGRFPQIRLPRIPGRDFAGVVAAGPAELIGQEVWGGGAELGFTRDGTHAQYLAVPTQAINPKPAALTMEQAGVVGVPFLTASLALNALQLKPGEALMVVGARGAVGSAAVQIGHLRGLRVIGAERASKSADDAPYEAVSSERPEDMPTAVRALTDGRGVGGCLDTVGGPLFNAALGSLAHGGRLATITAKGDGQVQFDLRDFYHRELHLIGVDSLHATMTEAAHVLAELRAGFETGALQVPTVKPVPLQNALDAYVQLLDSQKTGASAPKIALIPHETAGS